MTDEFSALVLKMLAKKKEDRPANFHEVLIALRKVKDLQVGTEKTPRRRSSGG